MVEVGAQLFTLRDFTQTPKDFERTISKVAAIGYKTVQLSAIGASVTPKVAREVCDKYGIRIVLTHSPVDRILHDTENLIHDHEVMGCKYIGLGSMPAKYQDPEWIRYFVEDFRGPLDMIRDAGMLFMYHNHDLDFFKADGKYLLDYLLDGFAPDELGVTLDTYWLATAGVDPLAWIRKCSGRIPCVHLKDRKVTKDHTEVMAPVMEGNIDFAAIMAELEKTDCKYALVEQDVCEGSPFTAMKMSLENLKSIGYGM